MSRRGLSNSTRFVSSRPAEYALASRVTGAVVDMNSLDQLRKMAFSPSATAHGVLPSLRLGQQHIAAMSDPARSDNLVQLSGIHRWLGFALEALQASGYASMAIRRQPSHLNTQFVLACHFNRIQHR